MTPQEKELILSVANKLKQSPNSKKDSEAEAVINSEIASQPDVIYKLTQAVLVQEMALKNLKEQNEYLQKNSEYYKEQNNRGTFSRMFGGLKLRLNHHNHPFVNRALLVDLCKQQQALPQVWLQVI